LIELVNVTKEYNGIRAVDNISFKINDKEFVVIIGTSGCGKTTTLKMINKLIKPTSGEIYINGEDTSEIDPIKLRRSIGYVIQEIGLMPHMSVEKNIALVPQLKGWPSKKRKKRAEELIEFMNLDPDKCRHKKPSQLSGGQRQRVGVARALAADPDIILMDEPFGALDPLTKTQLQHEFTNLLREVEKTVVFVTHDMQEAVMFADKIVIMNKGKIVQVDTPQEIFKNPANDFVRDFFNMDDVYNKLKAIKVEAAAIDYSLEEELDSEVRIDDHLSDAIAIMLKDGVTELHVKNTKDSKNLKVTFDSINKTVRR